MWHWDQNMLYKVRSPADQTLLNSALKNISDLATSNVWLCDTEIKACPKEPNLFRRSNVAKAA